MSSPWKLPYLDEEAAHSSVKILNVPDAEGTRLPSNTSTGPPAEVSPEPSFRVIGSNLLSTDITTHFNQASSALRHGDLVKDEGFSLFEAVGALEIGDPKMDSGLLKEGWNSDADFDCETPRSPGEIVWLMDELLCCEVAWLTGYPLSQTIFTSSYIDSLLWPAPKSMDEARFTRGPTLVDADQLLHLVFRVYCLALVKSCDFVHTMVTSQHYYEEEDFASQLFHRELLRHFGAAHIQALIHQALSWLETAPCDEELKLAITQRLIFRQHILRFLDQDRNSRQYHIARDLRETGMIDALRDSSRFGVSVPEAFSLKIQQSLASSVPPRPMIKVEFRKALGYFEDLFADFADVSEIFQADGSADILTAYCLFMARKHQPSIYIRALLQSLLEQDHKVLGRYENKTFVFDDLRRLVLPDSPILGQPDEDEEVPSEERLQITNHLDTFVSKVILPFINLFRTACLNRCRIRRTLCHAVIEWDQLQAEGEEIDEAVRKITNERPQAFPAGGPATYSYPLSSWIYHHKLQQMENLVQVGFELSVYAPQELPSMYWYLSHLCSVHLSHLDRISYFVEKSAPKNGRSFNYQSSSEPRSKIAHCLRFLFRIFTRLKATEALANALHLLYTLLTRRSQSHDRQPPYASGRLRYELRMRPFLHLSIPEPPDFEEFETATKLPQMTDTELLNEAQRNVTQAKVAWDDVLKQSWNCQPTKIQVQEEFNQNTTDRIRKFAAASSVEEQWTQGIRCAVKACIGTSISIAVLRRKWEQDRSNPHVANTIGKHEIPEPNDKDYWHKFWLVPRILS